MSAAGASEPSSLLQSPRPKRRLRTKQSLALKATKGSAVGSFIIKERHDDYLVVHGALDDSVLERLDVFLKRKRPTAAKMKEEGGNSDDERKTRYDDRDSKVTWIDAPRECPYLHDRLFKVTSEVCQPEWSLFQLDPTGTPKCEFEMIQYAVYGEGQHFQAWHQDAFAEGHDLEDARQLTIVAMLTNRQDYKGGNFQVKVRAPGDSRKKIKNVTLDRGDAIVFPAKKLLHRVTPVKSGIRKTLVFWANDKMSCIFYNPSLKDKVKT